MRRGTHYNAKLAAWHRERAAGRLVLPSLQPAPEPGKCPDCPHPWGKHVAGIGCLHGWTEGAIGCQCMQP